MGWRWRAYRRDCRLCESGAARGEGNRRRAGRCCVDEPLSGTLKARYPRSGRHFRYWCCSDTGWQGNFRLVYKLFDDMVIASIDQICAAVKDVFDETRVIAELAGALSIAGMKNYER